MTHMRPVDLEILCQKLPAKKVSKVLCAWCVDIQEREKKTTKPESRFYRNSMLAQSKKWKSWVF